MSIPQLKFRALIHKMSFMKSDLEFHRAEHSRRRQIFYHDLEEYIGDSEYMYSEAKAEKNFVYPYSKKRAVEVPELEKQTKDIFKKVAKITHPDIDKGKTYQRKFIDARTALDDKDWFAMYQISADLGIDLPDITDAHIEWLNQEVYMTEEILRGITTTYEWAYSNDGANKQQLLTTYCMLTCKLKE